VASVSSTDALFQQGLWIGAADASNTSISVDFSALNSFSASDPIAFLESTAALAGIDFTGAASFFPASRGIPPLMPLAATSSRSVRI